MTSSIDTPQDMPSVIIAVGGLKGGVGKTTIAIFIALVYAIVHGKRVLFVDADPKSQSGWDWWKGARDAGSPLPFDIEVWAHAKVGEMVADRAPGKYDVVIMDTGGDSDAILASAVTIATAVLLVTTPNKADMRRLAATFTAARKAADAAGRAGIGAGVVFTKVDNRRDAYNEKIRGRTTERLPVLESFVSLRTAVYADAYGMLPDESDLEEVTAVVKELAA